MVVITAHLHLQGVSIFQYIDDWLLVAALQDLLLEHIDITLILLWTLGIVVNFKKSCLTLTQCLPYIEATLDSSLTMAYLPMDREIVLQDLAVLVQSRARATVLQVQQLLGL